MRHIDIRLIKNLFFGTVLLSFLLVSCTSGKKKSEEVKEEISELLKDQESNDVGLMIGTIILL